MINIDKVIKFYEGSPDGQYDGDVVEYLKEYKRLKQFNWVSVKDRLPEEVGLYFCKDSDGYKASCLCVDGGFIIKKVTHWRDEPEPPKEGEG